MLEEAKDSNVRGNRRDKNPTLGCRPSEPKTLFNQNIKVPRTRYKCREAERYHFEKESSMIHSESFMESSINRICIQELDNDGPVYFLYGQVHYASFWIEYAYVQLNWQHNMLLNITAELSKAI